jgi:hypothetical protein
MSLHKFTELLEAYLKVRNLCEGAELADHIATRELNSYMGWSYTKDQRVARARGRPLMYTLEERAANKLEYERQWREKNKERYAEIRRRYYQKNKQAISDRAHARRLAKYVAERDAGKAK